MGERRKREPGPDHPIDIERNPACVIVTLGGREIARTHHALTLREADLPPVHYIPRGDVEIAALARSDRTTHCPYKGDACYFQAGGRDVAWSYEQPFTAVEPIADHLAFYPDRVDSIEQRG